ncbi:lanthionine synthetase C family protein [Chitinophaga rhizophila]|uniref:Lanthionine synthetase C family protein n=1 Tax=Chitinophaga rhizophila TaxID=2866212 RepID=A0ABS7G9X3_9BACT|nr:lanthionine synthetase C family protein [Chitinophaga rhizophila]MBW8684458.1 lanthionine synthetase C family protein [Chitinophaga rhizophila]
MDYKKSAGKTLREISASLDSLVLHDTGPGLLGGYTGAALFYAYYYQLTEKRKHLKRVHQLLENALQDMGTNALPFSYCSGIAGIVWGVQHLMKAGFAGEDGLEDIFEDVDEVLGTEMTAALQQGGHDFLHQGLGIALYFLEREQHPVAGQWLEAVVNSLQKTAITTAAGITWQDHLTATPDLPGTTMSFNLGMAHGLPAILSILGMIHQKGIATRKTADMLRKGISWLQACRNPSDEGGVALYPVLVNIEHQPLTGRQSRMGWCYGDLGIATLLLNAGSWLGDDSYRENALQIFEHTLKHRNISNSHVHDACLCHGSAGIAHIYRRAWLQTKEPLLLEGATYWLQHTLQQNTHQGGPAGFRFYGKEEYENSYGILEGVAGIGLSLIAAVNPEINPAWDRCMLLC